MWIMTASPVISRTVINFSDSIVQLANVTASALMPSAGICKSAAKRDGREEERSGGKSMAAQEEWMRGSGESM